MSLGLNLLICEMGECINYVLYNKMLSEFSGLQQTLCHSFCGLGIGEHLS